MSEHQHTPGPWAYQPDFDERISPSVVVLDNNAACGDPECCGPLEYYLSIKPADARLISAAPTLLMALEMLLEQAEGFSVSGVYFNEFRENRDALDTAYDAIAKATGQS